MYNETHHRLRDSASPVLTATHHSYFSLDLAFNIRGQRENTPYSLSEPNESGIVNRQSGGEKLKYVIKFYTGGTCHVIRACAMTI